MRTAFGRKMRKRNATKTNKIPSITETRLIPSQRPVAPPASAIKLII